MTTLDRLFPSRASFLSIGTNTALPAEQQRTTAHSTAQHGSPIRFPQTCSTVIVFFVDVATVVIVCPRFEHRFIHNLSENNEGGAFGGNALFVILLLWSSRLVQDFRQP